MYSVNLQKSKLMFSIYRKELSSYFSSLIAYITLGVFLLVLGLFMWVFGETSIFTYNYAGLGQLFTITPLLFTFLIPAVTMRSFAEEKQDGTIELLKTKPISDLEIILAKYFASFTLVILALIPTLIYVYSVYMLGSPKGNLDMGGTIGSYFGLVFLVGAFVSIGMFSSSITTNQIVAFVLGTFLCFFFYWAFYFISKLPIFIGNLDDLIERMGIAFHFEALSRGVLDTRNIIYFLSLIVFFIAATVTVLKINKK